MPLRIRYHCKAILGLTLLLSTRTYAALSLPYNPTRILLSSLDDDPAYIFQPTSTDSTQFELVTVNYTSVDSSSLQSTTVVPSIAFISDTSDAFIPIIDEDGNVFAYSGSCSGGSADSKLWKYSNSTKSFGEVDLGATSSSDELGAKFLSAGMAFSTSGEVNDSSLYVFGGMCPKNESTADTWQGNATYSNLMTALTPDGSSSKDSSFGVSSVSTRAPPLAEAGFAIAPLTLTVSNLTDDTQSRQQNFVFVGGQTAAAFLNMSQLALYSLPEESWSFVTVKTDSNDAKTDLSLAARSDSVTIEPRSGHTAVLSSDGSQIVIFGGWVGDVQTPATPQLLVLEVGEGYGGEGDWAWTVPDQSYLPIGSGAGLFGHGAAMLPGNVMMIAGGYNIPASTSSTSMRDTAITSNSNVWLFNASSKSWVDSYTAPTTTASSTSNSAASTGPLHSAAQKAGLGTGIAVGAAALVGLLIFLVWYNRRRNEKRRQREQQLRDMAFGVETFRSDSYDPYRVASRDLAASNTDPRHKRNRSDAASDEFPWAPVYGGGVGSGPGWQQNRGGEAERTGLLFDVPSPTRGLRRGSHSSKNYTYQPAPKFDDGRAIHPIDERDEYEARESGDDEEHGKQPEMREVGSEDPFKDPPRLMGPGHRNPLRLSPVTKEDLRAAGIDVGDAASTKSGESWVDRGLRGVTPEKSDRTSSSLSDKSSRSGLSVAASSGGSNSIQHSASAGMMSRSTSMRSSNLLFGSSVGRGGPTPESFTSISQGPSQLSYSPTHKRRYSLPLSTSPGPSIALQPGQQQAEWDQRSNGEDTFSTANTHASWSQLQAEGEVLLGGAATGAAATEALRYSPEGYYTPPESPSRSPYLSTYRRNSKTFDTTSIRNKINSIGGSVRRAFTSRGIGLDPSPAAAWAAYDIHPQRTSYTPYQYSGSENVDDLLDLDLYPSSNVNPTGPRRAVSASAALLKKRQGAKDWDWGLEEDASATPTLGTTTAVGRSGAVRSKRRGKARASAPPSAGIKRKPVPNRARASTVIKHSEASGPGELDSNAFEPGPSSYRRWGQRGHGRDDGGDDYNRNRDSHLFTDAEDSNNEDLLYASDTEHHEDMHSSDSSDDNDDNNILGAFSADENDDDDEWDVEAAVQRRSVQVMFTVPKERLRVVNADAESMISMSMSRKSLDVGEGR